MNVYQEKLGNKEVYEVQGVLVYFRTKLCGCDSASAKPDEG